MSDDMKSNVSCSEGHKSFNKLEEIPWNKEVFRNNTTAVEVIVKGVSNKKRTSIPKTDKNNITFGAEDEVEHLKCMLFVANKNIEDLKRNSRVIMFEMQKQLAAAKQKELQEHTKNILLHLEIEKMRTLLESHSKIIRKLKKEFLKIKRLLRPVIKALQHIWLPEESYSDSDYTKFENSLNGSPVLQINVDTNTNNTNDSLLSDNMG